ncbi:MAG TPA: hypothetical protein VK190_04475 [Pseudoneobacillus sp.]|nr:hypothetical protein [Pseudoneobacillus sp.]
MDFIKGERKEVRIKIASRKNDPFTIDEATYELVKWGDTLIETSGVATITDKEVSAIIEPLNVGTYNLTFTYKIVGETMKAPVQIKVR